MNILIEEYQKNHISHHRWCSRVGVMPMNSTYIDWCWWCDPGRVAGECGGRGLIRRSAQTSVEFGVFLCTRRTRPNKHGTEIFCKYPTVKYFPESDDCTALRSSLVVINNQSDFIKQLPAVSCSFGEIFHHCCSFGRPQKCFHSPGYLRSCGSFSTKSPQLENVSSLYWTNHPTLDFSFSSSNETSENYWINTNNQNNHICCFAGNWMKIKTSSCL